MTISKHSDFGIADDSANLPSITNRIDHIVAQRDKALALAEGASEAMSHAYKDVMRAVAAVQLVTSSTSSYLQYGHRENPHYNSLFNDRFVPEKATEAFRKAVDTDIWQSLIEESGVESWMDHQGVKEFRKQLATDVPEVNPDNVKATFETLFSNRREMFLRGMANVFGNLDRRFKSHDVFKVGSRIIIERITGYSGGFERHGSGACQLNDVDRCLRKVLGLPDHHNYLVNKLDELQGRTYGPKRINYENDYIKVRIFFNGNAHIYLSKTASCLVNMALAEYL